MYRVCHSGNRATCFLRDDVLTSQVLERAGMDAKFAELTSELAGSLDGLPLNLLSVQEDIQEQVCPPGLARNAQKQIRISSASM